MWRSRSANYSPATHPGAHIFQLCSKLLVCTQDSANRSILILPQYSVWWTAAVNFLHFCHWSSFATTRNVLKNEHCLIVLSPWALDVCLSSQSIHCYSHAPAPERSCCLVRVTALRKASHMRWEMPSLLSATLSEQRYMRFILHFDLMSCNISAWLFFFGNSWQFFFFQSKLRPTMSRSKKKSHDVYYRKADDHQLPFLEQTDTKALWIR